MDNTEKIEKTLNGIENIRRANVNPFFYEKVRNRLDEKNNLKSSGRGFVFTAVLTMILILILNITVLKNYSVNTTIMVNETKTKQDISSFAKEYFSLNSTYSY